MVEGSHRIVIRPPSEAESLLLQATYGCSHNKCAFCLTYKSVKFEIRPLEHIKKDIELAARWNPSTSRVFLCDGDAMYLSFNELTEILDCLNENFPQLERVGVYANAPGILMKAPEELLILKEKKLGIAYLGLESGNDRILERMKKGTSSEEMIMAVRKAEDAGIKMSVIVLLGLGGTEMSKQHAIDSADAVSRMNPSYLSALTLMLLPGTPLFRDYERDDFEMMGPEGILNELKWLIENIDIEDCVFRTNHASNYLPISGMLNEDREQILDVINMGLSQPALLRPDSRRAL